jgi:hypothetical protein
MGEGHEEDEGGGELPGAFVLGWAGQLKLTGSIPFDGQVTAFPELQEVKAAPVTQVVDKDFEDGFPNAGMLPAMETLITDLPRRGLRGDVVPGLEGFRVGRPKWA